MRRSILLGSLLLLAGCATPIRYNVYVTGYTAGPASSIPAGARVAVLEDPRARNPLLEHEVAEKARRALTTLGFQPAAPAEADVAVTLKYGADTVVGHSEATRYVPGQSATVKDSTGKVIGTVAGDASFVTEPVTSTEHVAWLTMTAIDAHVARDSTPRLPLWIGETKSAGFNLPLRAVIDILLVPTSASFGRNHQQTREVVRADDPRLAALRTP